MIPLLSKLRQRRRERRLETLRREAVRLETDICRAQLARDSVEVGQARVTMQVYIDQLVDELAEVMLEIEKLAPKQ